MEICTTTLNKSDLTGEYGDNRYIITRGDSRISLTLPRDNYTVRLNRDDRLLIDDYQSSNVLAYRLTKPFKLGSSFNNEGVLRFVLQECNTEDSDNLELHIANYYDYFPRDNETRSLMEEPAHQEEDRGKKVWL